MTRCSKRISTRSRLNSFLPIIQYFKGSWSGLFSGAPELFFNVHDNVGSRKDLHRAVVVFFTAVSVGVAVGWIDRLTENLLSAIWLGYLDTSCYLVATVRWYVYCSHSSRVTRWHRMTLFLPLTWNSLFSKDRYCWAEAYADNLTLAVRTVWWRPEPNIREIKWNSLSEARTLMRLFPRKNTTWMTEVISP